MLQDGEQTKVKNLISIKQPSHITFLKMNKNLVICPSLFRTEQLKTMVESFYKTSCCSDLIILTNKGSITKLINSVNFDNYQYISVTNDDFVYHTPAWDSFLINKIELKKGYGIAFGDDGTSNSQLPTTAVMSSVIFKALGWIQLPTLEHLCGDLVWQYIGKKLDCLYYDHNVKIEHRHFLFNKSKKDVVYEKTNSKEMYQKDNEAFRHWVRNDSIEDINRIRKALDLFNVPKTG